VVDGWTANFVTFYMYNSYENLLQAFEKAFNLMMNKLSRFNNNKTTMPIDLSYTYGM